MARESEVKTSTFHVENNGIVTHTRYKNGDEVLLGARRICNAKAFES
jgi:hypothetical protein